MNNLNRFYRGIVLKHLLFGYCKIFIPGVYDDKYNSYEQSDHLPSAEQATGIFGGNVLGNGVYSYPNIGATVCCFFWNGDQNMRVYFATTQGGNETDKSCLANFDRARCQVTKHPDDAFSHIIHIGKNNKDNYTDIEIKETGFININTIKDGKTCRFTMDDSGNITLESTTSITLKSNVIKIGETDITQQIDIIAQRISNTANTGFNVKTPAIKLDTGSDGAISTITHNGTKAL